MRIIKFGLILLIFVSYSGCQTRQPTENDIVGKWTSNDGSILTFTEDNMFKGENIAGEKMFDGFDKMSGKRYNEIGVWGLVKKNGVWIIQLMFKGNNDLKTSFFTQLHIENNTGVLSNKNSWTLYKYIGDPDEYIIYTFTK